VKHLIPVMEKLVKEGKPLLIIAEDVEEKLWPRWL